MTWWSDGSRKSSAIRRSHFSCGLRNDFCTGCVQNDAACCIANLHGLRNVCVQYIFSIGEPDSFLRYQNRTAKSGMAVDFEWTKVASRESPRKSDWMFPSGWNRAFLLSSHDSF